MSLPTASEVLRPDPPDLPNLPHAANERIEPSAPQIAGGTVIRLENVTVEYRAPRERIRSFKEYAIRLLQGRVEHEEFRALDDVSLEIRQGEVFGLVGHNGAGKSTLLKVVSRVLRPTRGRVVVTGHVAPLLELGAGFHPELSGRENVFLNGTLLGFSRVRMESLFEGIVEFAELQDFIDAPLRTYSTGMGVRLGFAVATASRPDILIVDEVLAVGDELFQEKCAARIAEFRQSGTTVLLVTHDTRTVLGMCDRAAWLDHGKLAAIGSVDEVVEAYHRGPDRQASGQSPQPAEGSLPKSQDAKPEPSHLSEPNNLPEPNHLEKLALQKTWFFPFELPSGRRTKCMLDPDVARIHDSRWQMLRAALEPLCDGDWSQLSCLDVGCNQGYFALQLAQLGCRRVVGIDAVAAHLDDANLMRRIWGADNLRFHHMDWLKLSPKDLEPFDVVLLFGFLYQLENPLGALRQAKAFANRAVVIETQLAPELPNRMEWGSKKWSIEIEGSFALLDRTTDVQSPAGTLTPISLCPSRAALLWTLGKLGFAPVEVCPPPPDAYEQMASGQRAMIIAYR
ncbi:MAG: ATP-binding cassette domain-containing protein [Acidobacteriota bacterium]